MREYYREIAQRKDLARQSRHVKRGSKSTKCPLSTDRMTTRQWKERNGPIMSCNFSKPIEWKSFKELSKELQTDYLNNLINTYNATAGAIAKMLGVTPSYFSKYIESTGLNIKFSKAVRRSQEQKDLWDVFLGIATRVEGEAEVLESMETDAVVMDNISDERQEESTKQEENTDQKSSRKSMMMSRFEISFAGDIDIDMIANSLRTILGTSSSGQVRVICDLMSD